MSLTTPSITNAAAWVNTDPLSDTVLNNQFNPLKNFTNAIDGFTRVATSAATYTITQNTEVVLSDDASGGPRVVNLPACTGQLQSITVKKIDTTFNTVTINRAGADTIESKSAYALSPATTSYVLNMPDESVTFYPNGTQWRAEGDYTKNLVQFRAFLSANQTMVANSGLTTIMNFDNDSTAGVSYDYAGVYNTGTRQFTAPVNGLYEFGGCYRENGIGGGASHFVQIQYFRNSSAIARGALYNINSTSTTGDAVVAIATLQIPLNAGDTMDLRYTLGTGATGNLVLGADSTYWHGKLIRPF